MPYDDDPYWLTGKNEAINRQIKASAPRSLSPASEVLAKAEKTARAPKVSPLLEAWLKERGLTVK